MSEIIPVSRLTALLAKQYRPAVAKIFREYCRDEGICEMSYSEYALIVKKLFGEDDPVFPISSRVGPRIDSYGTNNRLVLAGHG